MDVKYICVRIKVLDVTYTWVWCKVQDVKYISVRTRVMDVKYIWVRSKVLDAKYTCEQNNMLDIKYIRGRSKLLLVVAYICGRSKLELDVFSLSANTWFTTEATQASWYIAVKVAVLNKLTDRETMECHTNMKNDELPVWIFVTYEPDSTSN
jgi:hypothetical protein